ncbi:MAG TPA: DUF2177 family protein [Cyclobacteriaceae bacterium]|nr:DUF2177 family protein [Cyclobacteriaceae bacterium]
MSTGKLILTYALTTVVFFAVDMLWLGLIAKGIYNKHLGFLLADQVNWYAAIIFYLLFIAAIFVFVIFPALEKQSLFHAMLYGAMFGFITYATYDLTNLATVKNWPLNIVFIDMAWGTVLTAIVASAGYSISKWLMN